MNDALNYSNYSIIIRIDANYHSPFRIRINSIRHVTPGTKAAESLDYLCLWCLWWPHRLPRVPWWDSWESLPGIHDFNGVIDSKDGMYIKCTWDIIIYYNGLKIDFILGFNHKNGDLTCNMIQPSTDVIHEYNDGWNGYNGGDNQQYWIDHGVWCFFTSFGCFLGNLCNSRDTIRRTNIWGFNNQR